MATSTQSLVRDNSTLTNFKQWAKAISDFFTTAGWVQSSDTGQVNWSTIASVPSANNYVYEIWKPNDGLTAFYLKIEYGTGTASSNTNPRIRVSIGTATNGAGTLSGFFTSTSLQPNGDNTVSSTSTQWQCHLSGDSGRICVMMWRDDTANNGCLMFAVQRSLNSSGSAVSSYVTLLTAGYGGGGHVPCFQQTLVFGTGVTSSIVPANSQLMGFVCLKNRVVSSDVFNGNAAISPVFPDVGYFDNPMDAVAVGSINDFTEGAQYSISAGNMPYGVSHNYIATKNADMGYVAGAQIQNAALLMRYD